MRHAFLLTIALSLLAVSCSDDDPALSRAEFVERSNALCAESNQTIGRIVGEVFGAPATDRNDLQQALDEVIATSRVLHSEIAVLRPPPDMSDDVRDMLVAFAAATDAAEAQGADFWESQNNPWATANAMAAELGLDACSS